MTLTLKELRHRIMLCDNTVKDWIQLGIDVDAAISTSTEEEIQSFVDSGAGEMLDMILSGIQISQNTLSEDKH